MVLTNVSVNQLGDHGGVIFQNVHYTEDGNLLIQANGDYYEGPLKGVEQNNGKRTGGAIYTKEAFGPGSFEVKAKIMPRFGATTAFWTFNYLDGINSEIDFEFNVNNDFSTVWLTNWLTETNYNNHTHQMDSFHNDGNWHHFCLIDIPTYINLLIELAYEVQNSNNAQVDWYGFQITGQEIQTLKQII